MNTKFLLFILYALAILSVLLLLDGSPFFVVVAIIIVALLNFLAKTEASYYFTHEYPILKKKAGKWLLEHLFKKNFMIRIFSWYVLLVLLNTIVVEPFTHLSSRIDYDEVSKIPDLYKGSWKYSDTTYNLTAGHITINDNQLVYVSIDDDRNKTIDKCNTPRIYYDFSELEYKYKLRYKYLYPVFNYIISPLLPETLFGTQYISWECSKTGFQPYYLFVTEPSSSFYLEFFPYAFQGNKIGLMLNDHHSSSLFTKKL